LSNNLLRSESVLLDSTSTQNSNSHLLVDQLPSHVILDSRELKVEEPVGEGSYGKVWRATYRGQTVAVKIFLSEDVDVLAEVDMLNRVKDIPHIVQFLGIVLLEGTDFRAPQVAVVTRYMSNGSLYDILVDKSSPLYRRSPPMISLVKMAMQAAKGVRNLHRYNVIHRDLACRNMLLDDKMDVHVADFGFARLRGVTHSKGFSRSSVGPVKWEAPESLREKEYSEKTDVFSFGTVLYEIFAQCMPWEGYHAANVCHQVLSGHRLPLPINMEPVVGNLIERMWAHEPTDRPTMSEVYDSLAQRHHRLQNQEKDVQWEVECANKLMQGMTLMKVPYGRGKPNDRFFKVSNDLRRLIWKHLIRGMRSSAKVGKGKEKVISIELLQEVRVGRHTTNFKRYEHLHPNRPAFSIITSNRTIDLMCDTPEILNYWVSGLNFCINRLKEKTTSDHEPLQPANFLSMGPPALVHDDSSGLMKGDGTQEDLHKSWCIIAELRRGWHLLKFGGNKKPHERFFRLSKDMRTLEWTTHISADQNAISSLIHKKQPKLKQLSLSLVTEIKKINVNRKKKVRMRFSSTNRTKSDLKYDFSLCFVLMGSRNKELLTLLAPNQDQYNLWTVGLELVIENLKKAISEEQEDFPMDNFNEDMIESDPEGDDEFTASRQSSFRSSAFKAEPTYGFPGRMQRMGSSNYQAGDVLGASSGLSCDLRMSSEKQASLQATTSLDTNERKSSFVSASSSMDSSAGRWIEEEENNARKNSFSEFYTCAGVLGVNHEDSIKSKV